MKKYFILTLLVALFTVSQGQPNISNLSYRTSAKLFDLYEISFKLGSYVNPYDPEVINVYADFTAPDGKKFTVNGFYFEDYVLYKHKGYEKANLNAQNNGWRIRFTPTEVGTWSFVIHAIDRQGETIRDRMGSTPFTFTCQGVGSGNGFISLANDSYLKRDVVIDGKRQDHSFFPVGPNVAWYSCKSYYDYTTPNGIYEYEKYINSLSGNANYMRVWVSRYQYLSLYGPEYTQTSGQNPLVYFNSTINQKDAAELDYIINYAAQKGITIMPCFFNFGDFRYEGTDKGPSKWINNPYHTLLKLNQPHEFFTNAEARRITRNLIRYIVSRWGYATNIVAWELWNEVSNMDFDDQAPDTYCRNIVNWDKEMADVVRANDPFNHLVSTSMGDADPDGCLFKSSYNSFDFVQHHQYYNVQKARSKEESPYKLYLKTLEAKELYPTKPFFIGEFGFGHLDASGYQKKDPQGVNLHNTLWSTLVSGMMAPASFWLWTAVDKCDNYGIFKPLLTFCENMPILSSSFRGYTTGEVKKSSLVFPNNLETYYMMNAAEDTIYGWSQDTAFCYQSLRRFSESGVASGHFKDNNIVDTDGYLYTLSTNNKPRPSSRHNAIVLPLSQPAVGTVYNVRWFDTDTGLEIKSEATTATVRKNRGQLYVSIDFPSSIRNVRKSVINNTFGDAVFVLTKDNSDCHRKCCCIKKKKNQHPTTAN